MNLDTSDAVATQIAGNYPQPVTTVGQNLKRIRKNRKEQQQDVAARMGVDQPRVSNWEQGRFKNLKLATLVMLAKGYRCTVDDLIRGVDEEYDSLIDRDLLRHADHRSSSAAHSQPQQGDPSHDTGETHVRHAIAEELREAAEDFSRAIQDVANRLDRGVARAPATRKTPAARERKAAHLRSPRKVG